MQPRIKSFAGLLFGKVIPGLILAYLVFYSVFYISSLRGKFQSWNAVGAEKADTLIYSEEEWELIRMKTYLQARMAMSSSDSIGLTINMKDSLVQLEMKGVVLRQVRFDKVEMSRFFRGFQPAAYQQHFSKPFTISEIAGSIIKDPVTVRKVPKDTIEASQAKMEIDTSRIDFVEWHLLLDSAIMVSIIQSDEYVGNIPLPVFKYRIRRHIQTLLATNRDVVRFRKPAIYPEITVFIPSNEAKSFFRALPPRGQVVLKL